MTTRTLHVYGVFTPNGRFERGAQPLDIGRTARPIVYVRGKSKLCADCAAKSTATFDRKPASHKDGYCTCTACGQLIGVLA